MTARPAGAQKAPKVGHVDDLLAIFTTSSLSKSGWYRNCTSNSAAPCKTVDCFVFHMPAKLVRLSCFLRLIACQVYPFGCTLSAFGCFANAGGLAAKTGKETAAFTREEKDLLRGQGLMSLMSEEGTPTSGPTHDVAAGQYTGAFGAPAQETKSDNPVPAEGAKTGKEIDEDTMLHGQGVLSKQAGDAPAAARAPTGLGQDDIITSGNSFYGDATPQKDKKGFGSGAEKQGSEPLLSGSGRLAEKEVDLLHGQGVISKQTSESGCSHRCLVLLHYAATTISYGN